MEYQGIKKGKVIELLEEMDIPDGEEVTIILQREKDNQKELNFGESILKFREKHNLEENGIDATDDFLEGVRSRLGGGNKTQHRLRLTN
jgi:hypothetical protein